MVFILWTRLKESANIMTVYELLHKTSMDKIISVIKTRTNSADFGEMEVFIKHILKLDPVINC